jgi:hypothetical protein
LISLLPGRLTRVHEISTPVPILSRQYPRNSPCQP